MSDNPLVSIIVRTKDRPKLLKRALHSIASQTCRSIEVVLVNDGGCDLDIEEIKSILGDISLNYIRLEKNAGRAHAGNVGIENAKGEYIGFLDDDDELYPEHAETLVAFLEQSDYKVAYVDTEMITTAYLPENDGVDEVRRDIFSKDFSYNELLLNNYIPFNSVIFSNEVINSTGAIDEGFELYEDWDFIIRIGYKYPFYHIKKITAKYYQWNKEEQINQRGSELMKGMRLKILYKHREKILPEIILELEEHKVKKDIAIGEKDCQLGEKDFQIAYLNDLVSMLSNSLSEKGTQIAQLNDLSSCMEKTVSDLKNTVYERDMRVDNLNKTVDNLNKTITLMTDTIGWRLFNKARRMREASFPALSRRREFYDAFIRSIKYVEREGLKSFAAKLFQRYGRGSFFKENDKYQLWISKNEPDIDELKDQRKKRFSLEPKISIIVPTYNTPRQFLADMIESVLQQTYADWELCIADGGSRAPYVEEIIKKYTRKDSRIIVRFLPENKGIAGNSNEALSLAGGEYMTLLDHDDILAPFALFEIVRSINENPDADFIYSDEDKISEDGKRRFEPHFKPDWSPDTLRSYNYITHLSVFKRELIGRVGGFRDDFNGSQDYDLILRATEQAKKIIHIRKILYHWRICAGSAAGDPDAKPYAYEAAKKALKEHLDRIGVVGTVKDGLFLSSYKITYCHKNLPKVSIIIPNKNHAEDLERCVESIINKSEYKNFEIIVAENGSSEPETFRLYGKLKKLENFLVAEGGKESGGPAINNYAMKFTSGEILLFLTNDTEVINGDWIEMMLEHAVRKEVGVVGAKLYYPDGTIQHGGIILGIGGIAGHSHKNFPGKSVGYCGRLQIVQNLSAVTGSCLMMRKEVFEEIGGFDNSFSPAFNDVDLCLKIRERGYAVVYTPYAELYHFESKTGGNEDTPEEKERVDRGIYLFKQKWGNVLRQGDPYYSPNLTTDKEDFSIRV